MGIFEVIQAMTATVATLWEQRVVGKTELPRRRTRGQLVLKQQLFCPKTRMFSSASGRIAAKPAQILELGCQELSFLKALRHTNHTEGT